MFGQGIGLIIKNDYMNKIKRMKRKKQLKAERKLKNYNEKYDIEKWRKSMKEKELQFKTNKSES